MPSQALFWCLATLCVVVSSAPPKIKGKITEIAESATVIPPAPLVQGDWWKSFEGWQPTFTSISFRSFSSGTPIGFAYHDGFLSFANSQILDGGGGSTIEILWTQSGELLTIGLLAAWDGWLGVGVSPNGKMLYGGSNDVTVGWTDGSNLGSGGNTFIGDFHITSYTSQGIAIGNNQGLVSADVVRVGNQTAIVMQRFLRAANALSINATGVTTLIYAKGPLPDGPGRPLPYHTFASSVRLCFSGPRCPELNAPVLLQPIPNQTLVEAKPFQLNLAPYFRAISNMSYPLSFAVQGLMLGTGLRIDNRTGVFTGTPSSTDIATSPVNLTVLVRDAFGNVANTSFWIFTLAARCAPFKNCSSCMSQSCYFVEGGLCADRCQPNLVCVFSGAVCPAAPIVLFPISTQTAKIGAPFFLNTLPNFRGDSLRFSVQGLPKYGSGLSMDPLSGVLSGTPNSVDLSSAAPRPLSLAVLVHDKFGLTASLPFSLQVFDQNYCDRDEDCAPSGYCVNHLCTDYVPGGQSCTPNGVRCSPKFQCTSSFALGGFVCSIVDCKTATVCNDCIQYQCFWNAGSGCNNRCTSVAGCTKPAGQCPANGYPIQLAPIPTQRAVAGRKFSTSFRDFFADQDKQPLLFSLTPLWAVNATLNSSNWIFDGQRGLLSGVPTAQDVARSPMNFSLTVTNTQGLSITSIFTLVVDGQCGLISYCDTCLDAGCIFVGAVCRQDCPYAAVCTTDRATCPGRRLGQACSASNLCTPELVCLLNASGAQFCQPPVSCDAFYSCSSCLAHPSCLWSAGMCASNCSAGFACYASDVAACPAHALAIAVFNGPLVTGLVVFDQESPASSVSITVSLAYTTAAKQDSNHSWRIHNNAVQNGYDCTPAGTVFNPLQRDATLPGYAAGCAQDSSQCQMGDLSGKYGSIDLPSGVRTFRDPLIALTGKYTLVGKSLVVYSANGVLPDRLACATINLVDPGPPRIFAAIPNFHALPNRPISILLGSYFFNPAPNFPLTYNISDLSLTRMRFNARTGLLEGNPGVGGPPIQLTITATNNLGAASQTFTFAADGVCILDADCAQGFCSLGLCFPYRDAHQTCGLQAPCAGPFVCTTAVDLRQRNTCELVECDPTMCSSKGYCANGACMPFRWMGESCNRAQICAVGLDCQIRFSGQGTCVRKGALVPPITSVEGLVVSFSFANYLAGSSYVLFGLPPQTGLTMDPATGLLFGRLAYADANARQPLLLTAFARNSTWNNSQATLALTVKPAGTCGMLSSCRQCIATSCSWCPNAGTCSTECPAEDPTHTCPLERCVQDQDCWGGGCYQGQCVTFRAVGDNCNFEDQRCGNGLVCAPVVMPLAVTPLRPINSPLNPLRLTAVPTPAITLVNTCQQDLQSGQLLPLQRGVVGQGFSFKVSDFLQPVTGVSGTPGVVYSLQGTRPGTGLQLTYGFEQGSVILSAPALTQADALDPQPQSIRVTALDPYKQPRYATFLLYTSLPRACSAATSCANCAANGCAWVPTLGRCFQQCLAGMVGCVNQAAMCPTCPSNATCPLGTFCSLNVGQCFPYALAGSVCNDFVQCAVTLVCTPTTQSFGTCQLADFACPARDSCTSCASTVGCIWDGHLNLCSQTCPQGRLCVSDYGKCPNGCRSDIDCLDGFCSGAQCSPFLELSQACQGNAVCAPGLTCAFVSSSMPGVCKRDGACSTSPSCQHCVRRGCAWAGNTCSSTCTAGKCLTSVAMCPICVDDTDCLGGYCLQGQCRVFAPIGAVCTNQLLCYDGLQCAMQDARTGICQRDGSCESKWTCGECAVSGCFWTGVGCASQCPPNQICNNDILRCQQSCASCIPYLEYCVGYQCVPYAVAGQPCGAGLRCAAGLLCTPQGTCVLDGLCSSSPSCAQCTVRGCQWASSCSNRCPVGGGPCYTNATMCPMVTGPKLILPIPDPTIADPSGFLFISFLQYFSNPSGPLSFTLTGLPMGSGLLFDATSATLAGLPTASDVNGALRLTVTAADPNGMFIANTFRLSFLGCSTLTSCYACAQSGCLWYNNRCSTTCAAGPGSAACISAPQACSASPSACPFCCLATVGLGPLCSSLLTTQGSCCNSAAQCCQTGSGTGAGSFQCCADGFVCFSFGTHSECRQAGGYLPPPLPPSPSSALTPVGGPMAPQTGQQGDNVFLDISSYFFYSGPPPVSYSMTGTPVATGLSLNPSTGQLTGAYSAADVKNSPFTVQFTATAPGGTGSTSARFTVTASVLPAQDCPSYVPCQGGYCIKGMCTQFQPVGASCDATTRCLPDVRCSLRPLTGVCEQAQCPLQQCPSPPAKCPPGASLQTKLTPQGCAGCVACISAAGAVLDPATFPCLAQTPQCDSPPVCPPNFNLNTAPVGQNYMPPCCPVYTCQPVPPCSLCTSNQYCKNNACLSLSLTGQPCPDGQQQCFSGLQCRGDNGLPSCLPPIPAPTPMCSPGGNECPSNKYCKFGTCATFAVAGQSCTALDPCASPLLCMAPTKTSTSGLCQVDPTRRCGLATSCQGCVNLGCSWSSSSCDASCTSLKCSRTPLDCTGGNKPLAPTTSGSKADRCASAMSCSTCTAIQCAWSGDRCKQYCTTGSACYSTPALCPASSRTGPQCPPTANTLCNGLHCQSDVDCRQGLKCCAMGQCGSICVSPAITPKAQWCVTSNDCPSSTFCNEGSCTPYVGVGASCRSSSQCPQPLTCQGLSSSNPYTQGTCRVPPAQPIVNSNTASVCCRSLGSGGCPDTYVSSCVCSIDNYCCERMWDDTCADLGRYACDLQCAKPSTTDWPSTFAGSLAASCCSVHPGAGCSDSITEQCVCARDSFCCSTSWDSGCVLIARSCDRYNCNQR